MIEVSLEMLLTLGANLLAIGALWAKLETRLKSVEKQLDGHAAFTELVTRLDERVYRLNDTLKQQPQTIALCVGEAIKAAFRYDRLQGAHAP